MSANILPHLLELRRRSIFILLWFAVLFAAFFFLANELFQILVSPLLHTLSAQDDLIATQIASPVFTPLKLAADAALLLTAPYALFHLWRFVSPGLYQKEQRTLRSAMVLSLLLFLAGVAFCYYLVLPFMFQFFIHALPKGVRYMPDMAYALDFITRMLLLFGLCFQVPLLCLTLVRLTLVDIDTLKKIRPYVIVAAFIIGMLLTPPDVFSQIMLAVPLCLLYETGIILAIYFV
ncbi:MAG: twin-arginine translocase subunit TatC [Legionella sp.]|uniref:twin-arginine translocase subunit TatC n=1 Tax=Legionella sp. TaxID=459 RepID=UPI00283EEB5A|nr:twin-arginine translocase subunit TatC [Legionella sp.]